MRVIAMRFLTYYLWIAPHILLIPVVIQMLRLKLSRQFPLFLSYVVFEIAQFAVLLTLHLSQASATRSYQWVFVFGLGIGSVLKFGVVYELAGQLLSRNSSLNSTFRIWLRGFAAVAILIAAGVSAALPTAGLEHVRRVFQAIDFSSNVIFVLLLIALVIFARALNLSWRSRSFGIVLGFGLFAAVSLTGAALRPQFGKPGSILIDDVEMGFYHICVLVWLLYLSLPESRTRPSEGLKAGDLEEWNKQLGGMIR